MPPTNMPMNLEETLSGIQFPIAKVQIINYAGEHGASEDAMEVLRALPVQNYNNLEEINEELGLIEEQPGSENLWSSNKEKEL